MLLPFNIILMRSFFQRRPFQKPFLNPLVSMVLVRPGSSSKSVCHCHYQVSQPSRSLTALGFWNDWFNALLYIKSDNLYPLQYLLMQIQQKYGLHRQSSRPIWSTGSCSSKRNRTYGHGCGRNPSNRDSISILPTLLCKRFDYRWCERIVLVESHPFSVPNFLR